MCIQFLPSSNLVRSLRAAAACMDGAWEHGQRGVHKPIWCLVFWGHCLGSVITRRHSVLQRFVLYMILPFFFIAMAQFSETERHHRRRGSRSSTWAASVVLSRSVPTDEHVLVTRAIWAAGQWIAAVLWLLYLKSFLNTKTFPNLVNLVKSIKPEDVINSAESSFDEQSIVNITRRNTLRDNPADPVTKATLQSAHDDQERLFTF